MKISTLPRFQLGPGFWAFIPEHSRTLLLRQYAARAKELLARHQACPPNDDRLKLIVEAAMEARALYLVAVLHEPSTEELDRYFDEFVIHSVSGIADLDGDACHEN